MKETNNFTGMVGMGRVINGRLTFTTAEGKGFIAPVSKKPEVTIETRTVEPHEVPRDIRKYAMSGTQQPLVQMIQKENELDVPSFLKKAPVPAAPIEPVVEESKSNLVIFPTTYQGTTKRTLRNDVKKVWNWLWDLEGGEE